jgi:hypothetical protein
MMSFVPAISAVLAVLSAPPNLDADIEVALGTAGLTPKTARFDPTILRFFQAGEFRTPLFSALHEDPWRAPWIVDPFRRQFAAALARPHDSLMTGATMLGLGTRRALLGSPIAFAEERARNPGALEAMLRAMRERGLVRGEPPPLAGVPEGVQRAAALVLDVAMSSVEYRRAAFAAAPGLSDRFAQAARDETEFADVGEVKANLRFLRSVDLRLLYAAGHDLAMAAMAAQTIVETTDAELAFDWSVETSWGWITLAGGRPTTHPNRPVLLTIDTGGDDTYIGAPATRSLSNWLSVVIDTAGDDRYLSDAALAETRVANFERRREKTGFGPGRAMLGVSLVMDRRGDDLYRTHRPGIASAYLGVALVHDAEGADVYEGYSGAQGFGHFGLGLLEDGAGDDQYAVFTHGQGYGGTAGFGAIVDRAGDDTYAANDEVIDFPSPQAAGHNVSMAQGAGNGRRADYLDGSSLSGGVGLLFDLAGNDRYACGVFGQGVGYWEGVGLLWDAQGDDAYRGQWYVQGASAHYAIGYLEDEGGDDRYEALLNMALGAGHDFGTGFLMEGGGNDHYTAPNLSLGAGNANGMGWFVDFGGNDRYESRGITLGQGAEATKGSLRERGICLGVFMDMGGQDTYPEAATWARNATRTVNVTDRGPTAAQSQLGVFWDR